MHASVTLPSVSVLPSLTGQAIVSRETLTESYLTAWDTVRPIKSRQCSAVPLSPHKCEL